MHFWLPEEAEKDPAGHIVQEAALAADMDPAGQTWQGEVPPAEYVPDEQSTQRRPADEGAVPGAQTRPLAGGARDAASTSKSPESSKATAS